MAVTKSIHVIHAADADQHLGNLQRILEALRGENRIAGFHMVQSDAAAAGKPDNIGAGDMVIVLLTTAIVKDQSALETHLFKLSDANPGSRMAEIIVDNIAYEPQFLAFPADLEPIRSRENMDRVWNEIGDSLREIFPKDSQVVPPPVKWKKYVLYLLGLIVLAGLGYWLSGVLSKGPKAAFAYLVKDPLKEDPVTNAEECYLPCKVYLTDQSLNAESIGWNLTDTVIGNEKQAQFIFKNAGEFKMVLTACNGNKNDRQTKGITVKAPPKAAFEIEGNGCTAPCEITLKNTSENATKFSWSIPGTDQNTSSDKDPGSRTYATDGTFTIQLNIENDEGVTAQTMRELTILKDNSPFADFSFSKLTRGNPPDQEYVFNNQSQNVNQYAWEVSKVGQTTISSYNVENPRHTFHGYGAYTVKLLVRNANGETASTFKPISITNIVIWQNVELHTRAIELMRMNRVTPGGGGNP